MRRIYGTFAGVLLIGSIISPASATHMTSPLRVDLRRCLTTLHAFSADPAHLQPAHVPDGYELAPVPAVGVVAVWAYSCDEVSISRRSAQAARFVLVTVRIEKPDAPPSLDDELLANYWDHYLLEFLTDSRALASAIGRRGFPAKLIRRISFEHATTDIGPTSAIRVPWPGSPFTLDVQAKIPDVLQPVHNHFNSFWHGPRDAARELELGLFGASDHFCMADTTCAHLRAAPDSYMANLVGGSERAAEFAVDHATIPAGIIQVPAR